MDWKGLWNKLVNPSGVLLAFVYPLTVLCCGGALVCVALGIDGALTYALYALAAIGLFYSVYTLVRFFPAIKQSAVNFIKRWTLTAKIMEDYEFRTVAFSIASFAFNILYTLFLTVMAIWSRSVWYGGLAFYNIALSSVRAKLLWGAHKDNQKYANDMATLLQRRRKAYRFTGWSLIVLSNVVLGCLVQLVWAGWSFHYGGLMIYVFALIAFLRISLAIHNMFKAKRRKGVITRAIRHINLASALVSILALQTAMIDTFSENGGDFRLANALLGVAVALIILGLGIYTVVGGKKKKEETDGK